MDWLKRPHASLEAKDSDGDSAGRSPNLSLLFWQLVSGKQTARTAFSLVELLLIVGILGVFAAIAIPRFNYGNVKGFNAEATAKKIVTDLRLTRSLAISDAANNPKGFELNMLGVGPGPYTGYQIKNTDTRATVASHMIDSDVSVSSVVDANSFKFEPLGVLQLGGDPQLTVSGGGKSFTITVFTATGMAKCVEN